MTFPLVHKDTAYSSIKGFFFSIQRAPRRFLGLLDEFRNGNALAQVLLRSPISQEAPCEDCGILVLAFVGRMAQILIASNLVALVMGF